MIGIDVTRISRFKKLIHKPRFVNRILHKEEQLAFASSLNKAKFLAARWAIKEAIYKTNNSCFAFDKILITVKNRCFYIKGYNISTSNEGDYYIAIVQKVKESYESSH